jgi:hypothetical protein
VHHDHRPCRSSQGPGPGHRQPPGGFHHDQGWRDRLQARDHDGHPGRIMADVPGVIRGTQGPVQLRLGDLKANQHAGLTQSDGSIMQGVGYGLMEELQVEDGRAINLSFGDYKLPTMRDVPPLTTVLVESGNGVGPYQIKGIGESPLTPVAPAIANAVADAVGVRIRELALTSEKIYRTLLDNTPG